VTFETADDVLEHFGVKGMHWGVRKEKTGAKSESGEPKSHTKRNVAIVLGSAAAVTAIAVGAVYAKKHMGVSVGDIPKATAETKNFAAALANEPVALAHSSRGRSRGYAFLRDGGMKNVSTEFINAGLADAPTGFFRRFGANSEKVAARFADPLGRLDEAGRPIGHDVILPASMARDVHNIDDVIRVAWPSIEPMYAPFYRAARGAYGPGY
jgi:hypothetical protein